MAKRTIYINGRFLTQKITGVQRYARNIVTAMDRQLFSNPDRDYEIMLVVPSSVKTEIKLENIVVKKIGFFDGHWWEQIELRAFVRGNLLVNLCNSAPLFRRAQFVVMHDAAVFRFPEAFGKIFVLWYKASFRINARFSKKIITVSEFSKNELLHFLKINETKVAIVPPAVQFDQSDQVNESLTAIPVKKNGYFLAVSSMDRRKNFRGIVNAFIQLNSSDVELVIVGSEDNRVFSNAKIPGGNNIKMTGYIDDKALISLYKNAIAFIYPSFYEGFGIPPLEAMSFGCPVIVSNAASLPEVCGDAALYCDPHQPSTIKEAMKKILENSGLRNSLKEKGKQRVRNFSYQQSAEKLLNLIRL